MLVTSIFSFSHNVFYPSKNKFQFFSHVYIFCCLRMLSIWTHPKICRLVKSYEHFFIQLWIASFYQSQYLICLFLFNSLPNDGKEWSKLEAFADNKINVTKNRNLLRKGLKTLRIKEKMLVNSIFFFSHNVFKRLLFSKSLIVMSTRSGKSCLLSIDLHIPRLFSICSVEIFLPMR